MATKISATTFFEQGKEIFRGRRKATRHQKSLHTQLDMFRAFFGTWPAICSLLWEMIDPCAMIHPKSLAKHLLWALFIMYNYTKESVSASFLGVDEDTLRKWARPWMKAISNLSIELIDFGNRFSGNWHYWTFCVDGVHCPIPEQSPFWKKWYSHKFCAAGLAYEIATAVTTGFIIWVNGPFPAGAWRDPDIFKFELAKLVRLGIEKGISDAGYLHCHKWLFLPHWRTKKGIRDNEPRNDLHEYIRARHEQTNGRITTWNCLSVPFRHDIKEHGDWFNAIVVITQLEIQNGFAEQFDIVPKPFVGADPDGVNIV